MRGRPKAENKLGEGLSDVDYKSAKLINPPEQVERLPPGIWLPISVAAHIVRCSGQTFRLMTFTRQLKSIRFPVGPILVEVSRFLEDRSKENKM